MTSHRTSTLENSAETQFPCQVSEMSSVRARKKRRMSRSSSMDTVISAGGHIVKNKRTRYSAYQTDILKKIFESTQYPDFEQQCAIAQELGVEKEVVKVWFKNRRARQKSKKKEEEERLAHRLSFLQRGRLGLPHFCCPMPASSFPMYPVFPSPCQSMMNYHGNTGFGLYIRPTSIFGGRINDNLYQNSRSSVAVPSQEHQADEPAYQREPHSCSSH